MNIKLYFLAMVIVVFIAGCLPNQGTTTNQTSGNIFTPVIVPGDQVTGDVSSEPSIEVNPQGQYFAKITVNEGELVKLDLQANDPDGDQILYKFSKPLNEKGEWQTKMGDAGEYPVTITASDGKLETTKTILLIIKAVNRAPVIEAQPDITITEGQKLMLELKAADPDKNVLIWKYDMPIGADGTWQTKIGDAGEYTIKATVSDGYLSDSTSFKVKVLRFNHAPTLEIAKELSVNEGETIKLSPKVSDPDAEDEVLISYTGWMTSDTYTPGFEDAGKHLVTVTVSDGKNAVSEDVWITVNNVNRAPSITGLIVK